MWRLATSSKSIKRNLVNSLSLVFGLIVSAVFLTVDLSVDGWVDAQFDQAMSNKANSLKSHVTQVGDTLEFSLEEQFAPEFNTSQDPQFYQLWLGAREVRRSPSLTAFADVDLQRSEIALNSTQIVPVQLPNGLPGKASLTYFLPKVKENGQRATPAYLTIYKSDQSLERLLLILDILLVSGFVGSLAVVRYLAISIVDKGLKPLYALNQELRLLTDENPSTSGETRQLATPAQRFDEIEPIRNQLNRYIQHNIALLSNEKRITGDIAHELKTPISEIIALTEVSIRYPEDPRIAKTYKQDVLSIALRMKTIVENLLLLQRTASQALVMACEPIALQALIEKTIRELAFKLTDDEPAIVIDMASDTQVFADRFSLETIMMNLLDNAVFYSNRAWPVTVTAQVSAQGVAVQIRNPIDTRLAADQLQKLTDPLFQVDVSRTDANRYGLGLSIVNNLCQQNGYAFTLNQTSESSGGNTFIASVVIAATTPGPR